MTEPILDGDDFRLPPDLSTAQKNAFAVQFNALIAAERSEDQALAEAEEAMRTPEDRAAAIGEQSFENDPQ